MKLSKILLFMLTIISTDAMWGQHIKVEKRNEHPFLVDHGRVAKSYDKAGMLKDSITISSHTGSASSINLFEMDTALILIDVNGMWYFVSKSSGKFIDGFWGWNKDLPKHYMGTYTYDKGLSAYRFEKQVVSKESVYQQKDPSDYSGRFLGKKGNRDGLNELD